MSGPKVIAMPGQGRVWYGKETVKAMTENMKAKQARKMLASMMVADSNNITKLKLSADLLATCKAHGIACSKEQAKKLIGNEKKVA